MTLDSSLAMAYFMLVTSGHLIILFVSKCVFNLFTFCLFYFTSSYVTIIVCYLTEEGNCMVAETFDYYTIEQYASDSL